MPINTTWTNPNDPTMDLSVGQIFDENTLDKIMSNLLHLGGTVGTVAARVYHSVFQSVPTGGGGTILAFNSERFDTNNMHDTTTSTSRLTCQTAGTYLIGCSVTFAANAAGDRWVGLILNGATYIGYDSRLPASGSLSTGLNAIAVYTLAVGNYIEAQAFQSSGGALNVLALPAYAPELWAIRLGV